jgi:hypothetical protein
MVQHMAFFPEISKIRFEGPDSKNPLSYRHYNEGEMVDGKSMKDHLRFAVCYWHTFRGTGSDPFGLGCNKRPWEDCSDSVAMAIKRVRVAFEFMEKLGVYGGRIDAMHQAKFPIITKNKILRKKTNNPRLCLTWAGRPDTVTTPPVVRYPSFFLRRDRAP